LVKKLVFIQDAQLLQRGKFSTIFSTICKECWKTIIQDANIKGEKFAINMLEFLKNEAFTNRL